MRFDFFEHRRAIWLAVAILAAFEIVPPWHFVLPQNGQTISIPAGYALLFTPPDPITRTTRRLDDPLNATDIRREYQPQIDRTRLFLQCGLVAIALGLWITLGPSGTLTTPGRHMDWLVIGLTILAVAIYVAVRQTYPALRMVSGAVLGLAWWIWYERRSKRVT